MDENKNNRTQIIKARVTEDERNLVKNKAEYYGYKNISKYLIDAAIYEKVTYVDLVGQDLIYDAYSQNTKELKKITKEIRTICKYATDLDEMKIKNLTSLMFTIIRNQKAMLKLIDEKMDLKVYQDVKRKKEMQEEQQCHIQKD